MGLHYLNTYQSLKGYITISVFNVQSLMFKKKDSFKAALWFLVKYIINEPREL